MEILFFILAVHERTVVCAYMDATLLNSAFIYFLGLDWILRAVSRDFIDCDDFKR